MLLSFSCACAHGLGFITMLYTAQPAAQHTLMHTTNSLRYAVARLLLYTVVRVRKHSQISSNRSTTATAAQLSRVSRRPNIHYKCYCTAIHCCYMPLIRFSKPAQIILSRLRTSKQTLTAPFAWPTTMYRSLGASRRHVIGDSVAGVSCRSVCRSSIARSVTVPSAPPQTCSCWHTCQQ
jgi:hypothetical protein